MRKINPSRFFLSLILPIILISSGQFLTIVGAGTSTPTSTPAPPTLRPPDTDMIPVLEQLAVRYEDCRLPCLWGLELDHPTLAEAQTFAGQLGQELGYFAPKDSDLSFYDFFLVFDPGFLSVQFLTANNQMILTKINIIRSELWLTNNPFALSSVLSTLGPPTRAYLKLMGGDHLRVSLVVAYDNLGITVDYKIAPLLEDKLTSTDSIMICPQLEQLWGIDLWVENLEADTSPPNNFSPPPYDEPHFPYWPLAQMAGFDPHTLWEMFESNPEACFQIPSVRELQEAGYPW